MSDSNRLLENGESQQTAHSTANEEIPTKQQANNC
jgi:hypothetical protein